MSAVDVAALRALLARATPPPWENRRHDHNVTWDIGVGGLTIALVPDDTRLACDVFAHHDAAFIVAAVNALPALLDEVERLREECLDAVSNATLALDAESALRVPIVRERDALRAELADAKRYLLADEERRKLTGDALFAEGEANALRAEVERLRAVAEAAKRCCLQQPASVARTQSEADLWSVLYDTLAALDAVDQGIWTTHQKPGDYVCPRCKRFGPENIRCPCAIEKERDAAVARAERAEADMRASHREVDARKKEVVKWRADFLNACDVGRRQEARAEAAEKERDEARTALASVVERAALITETCAPALALAHPREDKEE